MGVRAERCLGIEKSISLDLNLARALRERIKATARAYLQDHAGATLQQFIEHVQRKHSVALSRPNMCRIRQQLELVPGHQQSKAGSEDQGYQLESPPQHGLATSLKE